MKTIIIAILIGLGALALTAVVLAVPLLLLWNWVMPTVFDLPYITFWQAMGLNLLTGIMFRFTYSKTKE